MPLARRLLLVSALLLALGASSSSQTRPAADASPADAAARALNLGRFDQVDALLRTLTDPRALVLRAQADIERGRYPQAEMLLAAPASANAGGDAALALGLLQLHLGRRADGTRTLQRLLATAPQSSPADLVRLGRAARALGEVQEANGYFREASALAPDDVAMNIAWGELFFEKYNRSDALKSFQSAVRVDPDNVRARLGLASVVADEDPPAARKALDGILALNPNSVPAHLLVAELALDDRRRGDARASIQKALQVNPNSLEARSLEGAIAFLEGRPADFQAQAAEVLKINPTYGEVYRVAGDHLARNYRFEEAVDLTRRALALDRDSTRANSDLGMQLLRIGDEPGARRALEAAFKADPYNVVNFNSLSLLDTLDTFETITDGNIIMRLHPEEAAVMREYAMPLAKEALATLSTRWNFTPAGPILIEMFPKHDDFAVRTLGLPGLVGALGVCFGKVVTLDSPRARPPGEFSWQETLWHELTHVITLQLSDNRVPRWLTEGISEWEERRAGRDWGRNIQVQFAQALEAGKALKVKDLNDGFTNPQLISLAYYEASILVDHMVQTYGEPGLRTLVRAYARGVETDVALMEAYKITVDELQTTFDVRLERDFGPIRRALKGPDVPQDAGVEILRAAAQANPDSFPIRMRLAAALHAAKDAAGAIRELERAAQLLPVAAGPDNPNAMIAAIALEQKDSTRAIQALDAVLKVDHTDVESARRLAALVAPLNDPVRTGVAYERVVALDPFDGVAQAVVGRVAMQRRDVPRALRAFRAALAANPADKAVAHVDLAEAYLLSGGQAEAKRQTLAALEIAPSFERAQDLLLRLVGETSPGGGVR
ncbi:MAG: tetratricopeptide repeat protein [Vicinamibacterales bacterium]